MYERKIMKSAFDFDSGYLAKSPCRDCYKKNHLPRCAVKCKILARLQQHLVNSLSTCNAVSEAEEYVVNEPK